MAVIFQAINKVRLHANKAAQLVPFTLVDETDLKTLEAGVTTTSITVQISFGNTYTTLNDGTKAEIGNGDYTVRLDETDTASVGWFILRAFASGISAETRVYGEVGIDAAEEAVMAENVRRLRTRELK